jgi:hypothetical protein
MLMTVMLVGVSRVTCKTILVCIKENNCKKDQISNDVAKLFFLISVYEKYKKCELHNLFLTRNIIVICISISLSTQIFYVRISNIIMHYLLSHFSEVPLTAKVLFAVTLCSFNDRY